MISLFYLELSLGQGKGWGLACIWDIKPKECLMSMQVLTCIENKKYAWAFEWAKMFNFQKMNSFFLPSVYCTQLLSSLYITLVVVLTDEIINTDNNGLRSIHPLSIKLNYVVKRTGKLKAVWICSFSVQHYLFTSCLVIIVAQYF